MKRIQVDGRFREVERVEEVEEFKPLQLYNALVAKNQVYLKKKHFLQNFQIQLKILNANYR